MTSLVSRFPFIEKTKAGVVTGPFWDDRVFIKPSTGILWGNGGLKGVPPDSNITVALAIGECAIMDRARQVAINSQA